MNPTDKFLIKATLFCFLGMLGTAYYEHVEERELAQIERQKPVKPAAFRPVTEQELWSSKYGTGDFVSVLASARPVKLHRKRG